MFETISLFYIKRCPEFRLDLNVFLYASTLLKGHLAVEQQVLFCKIINRKDT